MRRCRSAHESSKGQSVRLERVEVQGFRSFRDLETFDFSDQPGVVFLTGRNEDEPALGRNGTGKSSWWDAVYWCLYGVASTGLLGPELSTWELGRGIYVHVRINGHRITRTWNVNTLHLDGEDATQQQVDDVVGLTREQFLFCAYMAQGTESFLDLTATEKTDLLASVLDLDRWLTYSDAADKVAREHAAEVDGINTELVQARASIDELRAIDYTSASAQWRIKRVETLVTIANEVNEAEEDLESIKARRHNTCALHRSAEELVTAYAPTLARLDKEARNADRALASTRHHIKQLKERTGSCPTCGQEWPHSHDNGRLLRKLLIDEEEQLVEAEAADEDLAEARQHVNALEADVRDHRAALERADRDREHTERTLKELARRAQATRSERDPFIGMSLDREERLGRLTAKVDRLMISLDKERAAHERAAAWVKGFKDVRLYLVAEALTQLEVEANSALVQLGLIGWEMRFAPDSETKKGNVKRGFSVGIKSPSTTRTVPWRAWSGGEAQRLRLAASMGLANLISSYTGYRPFVEVWDEPSDGMSPEGIRDMLSTFARRAATNNRQVWVVDHSALESGAFVETVTAVKRDGTTTLERNEHGQGE